MMKMMMITNCNLFQTAEHLFKISFIIFLGNLFIYCATNCQGHGLDLRTGQFKPGTGGSVVRILGY